MPAASARDSAVRRQRGHGVHAHVAVRVDQTGRHVLTAQLDHAGAFRHGHGGAGPDRQDATVLEGDGCVRELDAGAGHHRCAHQRDGRRLDLGHLSGLRAPGQPGRRGRRRRGPRLRWGARAQADADEQRQRSEQTDRSHSPGEATERDCKSSVHAGDHDTPRWWV